MEMHGPLRTRLAEMGWSQEEIEKTVQMMEQPEKKEKHAAITKNMDWIIYWTVLLVLTISNFLVSLVLIPFLLAMSAAFMEIMVVALGFIFGMIFNHLIRGLEHIDEKHHYAAALFIPAIAVANIIFMVTVANSIAEQAADLIGLVAAEKNAVVISLFYVGAFITPYIFSLIWHHTRKKAHFDKGGQEDNDIQAEPGRIMQE